MNDIEKAMLEAHRRSSLPSAFLNRCNIRSRKKRLQKKKLKEIQWAITATEQEKLSIGHLEILGFQRINVENK